MPRQAADPRKRNAERLVRFGLDPYDKIVAVVAWPMPKTEILTPLDSPPVQFQGGADFTPAFDYKGGIDRRRILACIDSKSQWCGLACFVARQYVGTLGQVIARRGKTAADHLKLRRVQPRFREDGQFPAVPVGHTMKHYPRSRFLPRHTVST